MANSSFWRPQVVLNALFEAENAALEQIGTHIVQLARAKAPVRKIFKEGGQRRRSRKASPELIAAAVRTIQNNKRLTTRQRTEALYLLQRHPEEARVGVRRHNSNNRRRAPLIGKYREIAVKNKKGVVVSAKVFSARGVGKGSVPLNRIARNVRPKTGFEPSPGLSAQLSSRGRYEVRRGRALTNEEGTLIKPGDQPSQVRVGGRLKRSITKGAITRDGTRATIEVGTDVPYALYVEFPTRHNAAQPFLLPALKEAKGLAVALLNDEMRARGLKRG